MPLTWTISHGTGTNGAVCHSYDNITELGSHLAHVLSAADWRTVRDVFDPTCMNLDYAFSPADAADMAAALERAADHRLMPHEWEWMARELAAAARFATTRGEDWTWT